MRALILVNPQAGNRKGAQFLFALRELSSRLGPEDKLLVEPTRKWNLQEQIGLMAPGMKSLVVVGGDGTVSQVLEACWHLGLSMPVGIVPLGTGNDMARSLGLYEGRTWHPAEVLAYVQGEKTVEVDLWGLGDKLCFSNYSSLGLDAAVVKRFCRIRKWIEARQHMGKRAFYFALYIAVWMSLMGERVAEGTLLSWEDASGGRFEKLVGGARVLALTNTPYYAAGALMEPRANVGDGLLEVTIFSHMRHYVELMATRARPFAKLGLQGHWWRVKARRLEIRLPRKSPVQADGEDLSLRLGTAENLRVERKGQVRVLVR